MVGILLLASGYSRRFGGHKLSAHYHGTPLIEYCLKSIKASHLPVLAIVRPETHELHDILQQHNIPILINTQAQDGISSSIRCGVQTIKDQWQGCLIALADMPWIQAQTYQSLAEILSPAHIAIPYTRTPYTQVSYTQIPSDESQSPIAKQQQRTRKKGHPVGLGCHFFEEILSLQGDKGARDLIKMHSASIISVPVNDPGILIDIDLQSDLNTPRP